MIDIVTSPSLPGTAEALLDADTIDELRALGEGEPAFFLDLVGQYRVETGAMIAAIEEALARREELAIRTLAHLIRGSSASVGAIEVAHVCKVLEEREENAENGFYQRAALEIRAVYERTLPVLEALASKPA